MATALSNTQKRYLRGLAHDLKAVLIVGAKGITDALVAEAALALEHHELLKVKIHAGDRELRDEWIAELVERSQAALVARIHPRGGLPQPGVMRASVLSNGRSRSQHSQLGLSCNISTSCPWGFGLSLQSEQ